ncbi:30S ribosomal protein S4 [archaeon]|nr:30S ribosomal protein S4 [archaeon]
MGDPRKLRKKYSTPSHPWQKERIEEEKLLMREYGFKNKKELWKLNSKLKDYKSQVKALISKHDEVSEKKKADLIKRLQGFNLLSENAILEDILSLGLKDLCDRRIQTVVVKKNLARSISQARQFITHEHVTVGNRKITSPSYLVSHSEELMIKLSDDSPFNSEDHPERFPEENQIKKEMKEVGLVPAEEKTEKKVKVEKPIIPDDDTGDDIVLEKKEEPVEVKEEVKEKSPKDEVKKE